MKITYADGCFVALNSNSSNLYELKSAGFTFNYELKKWATAREKNAFKFKSHFDDSCSRHFRSMSVVKNKIPLKVKVAEGQKLFDYQRGGVKFCLTRNHSYLAFEQGLGKTCTALTVINSLMPCRSLIVAPPFKILDWEIEAKKWIDNKPIVWVIKKIKDLKKPPENFDVLIVPDSILSDAAAYISKYTFSIGVVDEAHRFSSVDTKRTKALFKEMLPQCDKKILLSGTPMSNRPIDLFPSLSNLAWNTISYANYFEYGKHFCGGHMVSVGFGKQKFDVSGATNLDQLSKLLKPFMLIEKLSDHFNIKHSNRLVRLNNGEKKTYRLSKSLFKNAELADFLTIENNLGEIAKYRSELCEIKLKPSLDYCLNALNQDTQFLIFAIHKRMISYLFEHLSKRYHVAVIDGGQTRVKKQNIKSAFQGGEYKAIIAQVETMVGVDLFKGTRGIFVESPWSPRAINQAVSRLVRIGQEKKVLIDHLVLANSFEEYVLKRALTKQENIEQVITQTNTIKE
jgi:SNF2 family DNA or RNA helicase